MQILYGAPVAQTIDNQSASLMQQLQTTAQLVIVLVGDDAASKLYIRNKIRACARLNIASQLITMPENSSFSQLSQTISNLNNDGAVHGILVQAPLPKHLDFQKVIELIDPLKDVDGFHPYNVGRLASSNAHLEPCTPAAIIRMLKFYEIDTQQSMLIIGRSAIVGTPLALMLSRPAHNATITLAHSKTAHLDQLIRQHQLIISAVGAPVVHKEWVDPNAVIIDVGTIAQYNQDGTTSWRGDVDVDVACLAKSPVPKGVGPVTVAMLLHNTVKAALLQQSMRH